MKNKVRKIYSERCICSIYCKREKYEEQIDKYSSSIKQGDNIKIYYNSNNPKEIHSTNEINFRGYIILLVGIIVILIGIFVDGNPLGVGMHYRV